MYEAVVIGASAGGLKALETVLSLLPEALPLPVIIVQHIAPTADNGLLVCLGRHSALPVKEAEIGEIARAGTVYVAPPGYHLLVEPEKSFSLSIDARISYSCPSIDVLFESAADAYRSRLIGIVLTGANSDGSHGLKTIKERGGLTIVQNPKDAESPFMPQAAIDATRPHYILNLEPMAGLIVDLTKQQKGIAHGR